MKVKLNQSLTLDEYGTRLSNRFPKGSIFTVKRLSQNDYVVTPHLSRITGTYIIRQGQKRYVTEIH